MSRVARRRPLSRALSGPVLAALAALLMSTLLAVPASATTTVTMSVRGASAQCPEGKKFTIHSDAVGIVKHLWRLGPPHLGYDLKGGRVGASMAYVWDKTQTNVKSVYSAKVTATTYNGRAPGIRYAFADCT